jgi:hypothetical protein
VNKWTGWGLARTAALKCVWKSWRHEWGKSDVGWRRRRKLVGVETRRWFEIGDVGSYRAWMGRGRRTKLDLSNREHLDHSHGSATERTSPERERAGVVGNRLRA